MDHLHEKQTRLNDRPPPFKFLTLRHSMVENTRRECILDEDETAAESSPNVASKNYTELVPESELNQTIGVKRRYICDYARYLQREDYIALGIMLKPQYGQLLRENSDGTRVDLDQIKDVGFINSLYAYVRFKISQRK